MSAYVGNRRYMTDHGYNRRFPDPRANRRHYYDDLDIDLYSRRQGSWNNRQSYIDPELDDGLFDDGREAKMSTLQHHLDELKADNRQMSLRLSQAEGCLQDLDGDDALVHRSTSLNDRFDLGRQGHLENDHQRRLRRELRDIRDDLSAVRGSIQQTTVLNDDPLYLEGGGRHLSPSARRRRLRHMNNLDYDDDDELGEWGAKQLEHLTWSRQHSDLDPYRGRRGYSPGRSLSPTRSGSCVGYRSVVPRPLITQRNKFHQSPLATRRFEANYVNDESVFVPSSAADLSIGDRVKVSRNGGNSHGIVRYIGHLPGKVGPYLGLELENEGGKHDGIYNGFRYFQCKGYRGIFVPFDRVVLAWRQ